MSDGAATLVRECRTFTRLLARSPATPYVIGKYIDAHRVHTSLADPRGFDRVLVGRAASGPLVARMADAYARHVMPRGVLRRKLVLLLAILESSPGFHRTIDAGPERSFAGALVALAMTTMTAALAALAGLALFGPMHLLTGSRQSP